MNLLNFFNTQYVPIYIGDQNFVIEVIRNQDDYGGVYLIDDIYVSASWVSDKISLWAKDNFKVENNLENLVKDTEQFFSQPFKPCQPIQIKKPPVKQQEDNYDYDFQEDVEIDQNLLSDNQKGEQLIQNNIQENKKENLDLKNEDFDIFSQPVEEKQKQNQNGYEQESEEEDDFI
ncbi:hypothetical protein PPERSA_04226 [Pseudocohnilembus persalinus]|uniref:Uncharacterized protein n=1 Tax=Pseudocohnilembus persalinus TaxID=266149 RepID=A0A0V0QN94_PSEPJ|nr:hypothetical protein PPERSA_04226 [Pseudocohnilembus persalinus]|eukprot:KRX03718.1 hypothetical protein PPERSA_04226 [Pseudocohnilembus persalinus]